MSSVSWQRRLETEEKEEEVLRTRSRWKEVLLLQEEEVLLLQEVLLTVESLF